MKRSAISQRVDKGFTLIELVIALAIIGLGLSFVLPRMMAGWIVWHFRLGSNSSRRARRTGKQSAPQRPFGSAAIDRFRCSLQ